MIGGETMREFVQRKQIQKDTSIKPGRVRKVISKPSMHENRILRLQRVIGNQAVGKQIQLQTKGLIHLPSSVNSAREVGPSADAGIKEKYFSIVAKGSSHYMEAIQYLVDTFKIDASHATLRYDAAMSGAYAITEGDVGDEIIPIRFGPLCFDKSQDFGVISRAIAHEIMHSKQKSVDLLADHNEREFLAYYDTITRTDMPEITDLATLKFFIKKALGYYKKLPADKQETYADKRQDIIREGFSKLEKDK